MSSNKKIELGVGVDANPARAGLKQVEQAALDMAQAVILAGKQAGKGLDGIGDESKQVADKVTREEGRMRAAIQRSTLELQTLGKSASQKFEAKLDFKGLDKAKFEPYLAGLREVEQAAMEVEQAQRQAAQTARLEAEAQKAVTQEKKQAEAAQQSFLRSLREQIALQGKSQSDVLRYRASQLGVGKDAEAYISQMERSNQAQKLATVSLDKMGMSAKQTAFALRGVPAQFTDIITSLQGGQAPLTVLLQQGGQLKDMFGGVGNAAKALGGYVLGLVNPYTVAAAAVAGLAFAYYKGSQEATEYSKAIILSGNAVGSTASQLQTYAQKVAQVADASQGASAAAITAFAKSGKVAAENLTGFAASAIRFERATGESIEKTVEHFAALAKSPVEASVKLNEQYGYLTSSIYLQIKALEDQGKTMEAVTLAQKTFDAATKNMSSQVVENLGHIEWAWANIKNTIGQAASAMANFGRKETPTDQLSKFKEDLAQKQLERTKAQGDTAKEGLDKGIERLKNQIRYIENGEKSAQATAKAMADQNAQAKALIAYQKETEQYTSKREKQEREIAKVKNLGAAAGLKEVDIAKQIANIQDKYKEKGGGGSGVAAGANEVASIRAKITETQKYIDALKTQGTDALKQFGLEQAKLNEGEQLALKIKEELQGGIKGVARANKEKALAEAEALGVLLKTKNAEEQRQKTIKKSLEDYDKLVEGVYKSADSLNEQAEKQEAANAVFGKGALAIDAITLATLKRRAAELGAFDNTGEKYLKAIDDQINAQERLNKARADGVKKSIGADLDEWARAAEEQAKLYQDELALSGLTGVEREKIVAARQVELKLAKELSKIDQSGLDEAEKEKLRIKANTAAQIEGSAAVAKVVQDDWARTSESINSSITDALMRGFESGKDAAKNLRDTVINMFKTMVLRPTISSAVNMAAGAFGLGDSGAAAGGGGSSLLGMANNASSAYSAYSAVAGGISSMGSTISALGTKFGITAAAEFGAGMQGASLAAGLAGPVTTGGGAMGAGATAAGALQSVAAVIPYAAVALIVANALGVFKSKKIVGGGVMGELGKGELQSYDLQRKGGSLFSGPSYSIQNIKTSPESQAIQEAYSKLRDVTSSMADTLGVGSDAIKNFTTKLGTEVIHQEVGKTGIKFDGLKPEEVTKKIEEALLSANEEMAKFVLGTTDFGKTGESASQTLQRLAGSLTTVNTIFGNLGFELKEASLAGGDAASDFADLFGGMDKLVAATSSYYDNFYSEAERTANSTKQLSEELQKLGVDGLPATRDAFRKLVDEAFGAGNEELGASLISLSKDFADLTQETNNLGEAAAAAAEKVANEAKGLNTRLLQAQGDVGALRQQEIDSLDESNQAILKHIFAIEDKAKADADAAALAEKIGSEAASLNTRLMQAEGDLAGLRKEEVNAVNEANRALLSQVLAQERYNEIHAESENLVTRLLQVQGNTVALRERERSVLHESNQVLFDYISMLEDQAKATELLGRLLGDFAQYGMSDLEKKIQDIDKVVENSITSLEEWNQASYDNILAVERWADASRKAAIAIDAIAKAQSNFDDLGKAVEIEREALSAAFDEVQNALQAEITKFSNDLSNVKGLFARSAAAERTSLTDAANTQKSALQKQIDAMNGVSDASEKAAANLHSVIDALTSAVDSLRGIDALQKSNYADAVGQIDKMLLGAQQGIFPDAKDLSRPLSVITGNTSDSYASSFDFNRDQLVQAAKLEELSKLAGKELGFEDKVIDNNEKQLEALQAQIKLVDDQLQTDLKALDEITKWGEAQFNALEGIDASIVTMDEAQKAVAELTSKYQDDQVKQIEKQMKQSEDEHKKSIAALNLVYQAGLMQINQLNGVNSQLGSAVYHLAILSQSVQAAEQAKKEAEKAAKDVPGFAIGGDHTGGWRIVGEKGPELEFTGPAKYYDAAKTKDMLRGESSSDEVRQLREDNRAQASAMVSLNARLTKLMERWDRDGMPAVRTEDA